MTVSTTSNKISYAGNGSTTSFSFPFPGVAVSDIQIFITNNLGVVTQPLPTQFTVTLNAPVAPNPTGIGGSVLYPLSGSPVPVGSTITILRTLPQTQPTSLANQGTLYQTTIEQMLDYVTMLCQQVTELQNRAIEVQPSDPVPSLLPAAAQRANLLMGFDSAGNPIAIAGVVSNVLVSVAMQPVVTASTLINARAAMGVASPNLGLQVSVSGAGLMDVDIPVTHIVSSPFTVNLTHHMKRLACDVPVNIFLPKASTTWNGFGFYVTNRAHAVNLFPDPADNINEAGVGVSNSLLFNANFNSWFISTDGGNLWFF